MLQPARESGRVRVVRFSRDAGMDGEPRWTLEEVPDRVATEEPLEIRVRTASGGLHPVAVTMRTPGGDFELAAGFLFTEGLLRRRGDIRSIAYCDGDGGMPREARNWNVVEVRLEAGAEFEPPAWERNFYMSSSCGICGKASLDAVELQGCRPVASPDGSLRVDPTTLLRLPLGLREAQPVFGRTGGLHAAGLFTPEGERMEVREDVGRHNAVDRVVGAAFLAGRSSLARELLAVSGRASFEILQKARMAGIVVVAAVGAPSSLAVDFARRFGMTLAGFVRDSGFNVYAGGERIGSARGEGVPTP